MFVRTSTRTFSRAARSSSSRLAGRQSIASVRMNSSSHGHKKPSSDMPWALGAAVVFGVPTAYLLGPGGPKTDGHASHHGDSHKAEETKDDDVPLKDSEGTEADSKDVKSAMDRGYKADAPKDAKASEETPGSSTEPPADSEKDKPEQKEKPKEVGDGKPKDLGKDKKPPKGKGDKEYKQAAPSQEEGETKDDARKKDGDGGDSEGKDGEKEEEGDEGEKDKKKD